MSLLLHSIPIPEDEHPELKWTVRFIKNIQRIIKDYQPRTDVEDIESKLDNWFRELTIIRTQVTAEAMLGEVERSKVSAIITGILNDVSECLVKLIDKQGNEIAKNLFLYEVCKVMGVVSNDASYGDFLGQKNPDKLKDDLRQGGLITILKSNLVSVLVDGIGKVVSLYLEETTNRLLTPTDLKVAHAIEAEAKLWKIRLQELKESNQDERKLDSLLKGILFYMDESLTGLFKRRGDKELLNKLSVELAKVLKIDNPLAEYRNDRRKGIKDYLPITLLFAISWAVCYAGAAIADIGMAVILSQIVVYSIFTLYFSSLFLSVFLGYFLGTFGARKLLLPDNLIKYNLPEYYFLHDNIGVEKHTKNEVAENILAIFKRNINANNCAGFFKKSEDPKIAKLIEFIESIRDNPESTRKELIKNVHKSISDLNHTEHYTLCDEAMAYLRGSNVLNVPVTGRYMHYMNKRNTAYRLHRYGSVIASCGLASYTPLALSAFLALELLLTPLFVITIISSTIAIFIGIAGLNLQDESERYMEYEYQNFVGITSEELDSLLRGDKNVPIIDPDQIGGSPSANDDGAGVSDFSPGLRRLTH